MANLTVEEKKMVEDNHNLIYWFCKKNKLNEDDWYDIMAIALIKAAKSYKTNKTKFSTYASTIMHNEMVRELEYRERHWPDTLSLDYEYDGEKDGPFKFDKYHCCQIGFEDKIVSQQHVKELLVFFDKNVSSEKYGKAIRFLIDGDNISASARKIGVSHQALNQELKQLYEKYIRKYRPKETYLLQSKRVKNMKVKPGDQIKVPDEKPKYTVRARDDRYIICTRPYRDTVLYFIIDLELGLRGPDNMIFCSRYETDDDCVARLKELQNGEISVSKRNSIELDIKVA